MAANNSPGATGSRTHPAIIVAAVAVAAFAIVGTAALMGWLPKAGSTSPTSFASPGQQVAGGSSAEYPVPPAPEEKSPEPVKAAPAASPAPRPAAAPKPAPKPQQQAQKAPAQKPQTAAPARAQPSTPNYSDRAPVAVAANTPPPAAIVCRNCGTITAITPVEKPGEASGAGAVVGGIVGGVLGHQVGGGRGKDVATVAGAVGGAYAGHQIEKSKSRNVTWEVRVKLDDGTDQTVRYAQEPALRVGDKVKVEGNTLVRG